MATLWNTEAGLIAMAEELRLLASPLAIQAVLCLYQRPMSNAELREEFRTFAAFRKWTEWLEERGIIQSVVLARRRDEIKRHTPKPIKYWFLCDQHIGQALHEALEFLWRDVKSTETELRNAIASLDMFQGVTWKFSRHRIRWNRVLAELDNRQ